MKYLSEGGLQSALDRKSIGQTSPKFKLLQRISIIVGDIKKFICSGDKNSNSSQLYKIIQFRDHLLNIVN